MRLLVFIRDLSTKFPFLLAGHTLLLVVQGLIGIASVFAVAPIIDFFINPDLENASTITRQAADLMRSIGLPVTLSSFLAVFLAFQLLKNSFSVFTNHCLLRTKYAVLRDLMVGTFEDFFSARWLFFSSSKQGTILNTFLREMTVVGDAFGAMAGFFAGLLRLIFYLAVPFYISWQVTTLTLAIALLVASPFFLLAKVNYRLGKLNTSTANEVSAVIQESLSLAKVILGFGKQGKSINDLERAFDAHRQATLKSQTLGIATPAMYEPLGTVVLVIALFAAQRFAVPFSEMAVLLWALRSSIPSVGGLAMQRNSLANFFPSYEQVKDLRKRARELKQKSGELLFTAFHNAIAVENLTFAYPGHEPTLVDISFRIPRGKMVAFVGESGVGKSTLVDIIMGFNEPMAGQITIDGVPLQRFDINSYRRRIGYVPQDSVLFNMTILENLRWANEAATDMQIREACQRANADEFIEQFPDGYDTLVGDRGVRLSGGQCQRIALARAILRDPEILVLDEATSDLDSHSERLIQQSLNKLRGERTVVAIAHRLSTVTMADQILVLEGHRLVEQGSHRDLLALNGRYAHFWRLQSESGDGKKPYMGFSAGGPAEGISAESK